jgi:hypothetical protein
VVQAAAFEARCLNQPVVDIMMDAAAKTKCTHPNSELDQLILKLLIKPRAGSTSHSVCPCIKVIAMVDGKGSWQETWNSDNAKLEHQLELEAAIEAQKYRNHEAPYPSVGYSFLFILWCSWPVCCQVSEVSCQVGTAPACLTQSLQGFKFGPFKLDTARPGAQFRPRCFR